MHRTMKKLYRDHAQFSRLMDILEGELNGMEPAGGSVSPLLSELVSYISDYVDAFHHPVEDQLYQIMLARTDRGMEEMDRLLGDHLVITNMTRELRRALDDAGNREQARAKGLELVKQQRAHIKAEEDHAFPLLREELGTADFDHAARAIPALEDPMEDANMQQRYPALFTRLQQGV